MKRENYSKEFAATVLADTIVKLSEENDNCRLCKRKMSNHDIGCMLKIYIDILDRNDNI